MQIITCGVFQNKTFNNNIKDHLSVILICRMGTRIYFLDVTTVYVAFQHFNYGVNW